MLESLLKYSREICWHLLQKWFMLMKKQGLFRSCESRVLNCSLKNINLFIFLVTKSEYLRLTNEARAIKSRESL